MDSLPEILNQLFPLPQHPSWLIQDSTKLTSYEECPRKFLFNYLAGWDLDCPNIHLEFGSGMHLALEHLKLTDYSPESVLAAHALFLTYFRNYFGPETDDQTSPKNPECALLALEAYAKKYAPIDDFTVLYTEVVGSFDLLPDDPIHVKIDVIKQDDTGISFDDFKTGKRGYLNRLWQEKWTLSVQMANYTFALNMLFPDDHVSGGRIDGIGLCTPKRMKLNGEPYASDRDKEPDLVRVPLCFDHKFIDIRRAEVIRLYEAMKTDFIQLATSSPDTSLLQAFHRCPASCDKWGGCQYLNICHTTANPLRLINQPKPPPGFKIRFWDPTDIVDGTGSAHASHLIVNNKLTPNTHKRAVTATSREIIEAVDAGEIIW